MEPGPLYSSQLEQLTSVTHTQALRQASRQRNRYHDPGRGQPPHWILHYTSAPPLNFEAKSISRWHDEESLRKFFPFYILNQIWIFPQLQGLLQQHECEGEKGWVGNQLAQVILHAGSLEKRYSHFLCFSVLCQNTIGGLTFPTSLSFVWDEKQQKSKGGFYYFTLRSVKHKSFYYTDATSIHLKPLDKTWFALRCAELYFVLEAIDILIDEVWKTSKLYLLNCGSTG